MVYTYLRQIPLISLNVQLREGACQIEKEENKVMRSKNHRWYGLLLLIITTLILSCATTPDEEETVYVLPETERNQAIGLRQQIEEYDLGSLVQTEYQSAEAKYLDGDKAYNTDNKTSKEAFDEAVAYYQTVIEKGFPILTDNTKKETDASLALADELKAGVAVKDDYDKAKEVCGNAVAEQEAGNYEKAIELFEEANSLFQQVYEKAKEKKEKAELAIQEALDSLKASEEKAKEAEQAIEEQGD